MSDTEERGVAPGQSWILAQAPDWEPRRVEVVETDGSRVRVRNNRRRWWISEPRFRRIGRFQGHRGPGVLPPFEGSRLQGCLNAGSAAKTLPLDAILAVGFGAVTVTADDETIWSGDDETKTLADAEQWAQAAPERDWRVEFSAMLSEFLYQRQPAGWVLVWRGPGFA